MKIKYFFNIFGLFSFVFLPLQNSNAQAETTSELYKSIQNLDAILFEKGFNQCLISEMEPYISDDLEFYHDQGGITNSKKSFLLTIQQNICSNQEQKPIRKLQDNSLEVFPLYEKGALYGAIQHGIHQFFIKEPNKELYLTSTAKFTHLWIKANDTWKLKRVLSYDHQIPKTTTNSKKVIVLADELLVTYLGTYAGEYVNATISRKEKSLLMDSGDMQLVIHPETDNLFFANEAPLTFEFVSVNGKVVKMIVRENGKIVDEVKRVK